MPKVWYKRKLGGEEGGTFFVCVCVCVSLSLLLSPPPVIGWLELLVNHIGFVKGEVFHITLC